MAKGGFAKTFKFKDQSGTEYILTPRQKKFVECYVEQINNPNEGRGSATSAVIAAGYDVYHKINGESANEVNPKLACSAASENLTKPNIRAYLNFLLEKIGFTDLDIDLKHNFLIHQFENLQVSMRAIEHYDKKFGRIKGQKEEADKNRAETMKIEQELREWGNRGKSN